MGSEKNATLLKSFRLKKRLGALINRLTVYRELYDVETQAYEECITTRHNGLMWTREIALEEYLEGVIKNCENLKRLHEEAHEHYRSRCTETRTLTLS